MQTINSKTINNNISTKKYHSGALMSLTSRNIKLFFRDKTSVVFSLLSVLIIIALYALFLGDSFKEGLEDIAGVDNMMNSWVIAGIMAVISMTSTLGAFGVMVDDRSRKMYKDFSVSPVRRSAISGGYVLSAYCVGMIMSMIALLVGEIYITISGGSLLTVQELFMAIGTSLLSVLASSSMVFFIVSFLKSSNSFTTVSIVIGTLIGFLTGVYINMGSLPEAVQGVIKTFPVSYSALMFRNIFMERSLAEVFDGAPTSVVSGFREDMGIDFRFGEYNATYTMCVVVLLATAIIFFGLALLNLSRKRRA